MWQMNQKHLESGFVPITESILYHRSQFRHPKSALIYWLPVQRHLQLFIFRHVLMTKAPITSQYTQKVLRIHFKSSTFLLLCSLQFLNSTLTQAANLSFCWLVNVVTLLQWRTVKVSSGCVQYAVTSPRGDYRSNRPNLWSQNAKTRGGQQNCNFQLDVKHLKHVKQSTGKSQSVKSTSHGSQWRGLAL